MKRIVILCDGTWNKSDTTTPTNVVRLAQALLGMDGQGVVQVPLYIPGVGTGEGVTWLSRKTDAWLGGGLGWGLLENIVEAYRHLVFIYEPGDEVYIFGFSRGAYTARSLAGFLRSIGIVNRDHLHCIPKALERYRTRGEKSHHPGTDESHLFRSDLPSRVVTSQAELDWRRSSGLPDKPLLEIAYLGVWDSVGALGVPAHFSVAGLLNRRKYQFHDTDLSSMVKSARHAIALDERRLSFEPTRWGNLTELNSQIHSEPPAYREFFFAGDHGSVGGGGDITDLSSIALRWIVEGAQEVGLAFDEVKLAAWRLEEEPMGALTNTSKPPTGMLNRLLRWRSKDREGPADVSELHPTVFQRWAGEAKSERFKPYRPGSLKRIHEQLVAHYTEQVEGGQETHIT